MPPLPSILHEYIVTTNERIIKCNIKIYYKSCINVLGEVEEAKKWFSNKKDHIIAHLKKCVNFVAETTLEIREQIFELAQCNNNTTSLGKRKGKYKNTYLLFLLMKICNFFFFFYILPFFMKLNY